MARWDRTKLKFFWKSFFLSKFLVQVDCSEYKLYMSSWCQESMILVIATTVFPVGPYNTPPVIRLYPRSLADPAMVSPPSNNHWEAFQECQLESLEQLHSLLEQGGGNKDFGENDVLTVSSSANYHSNWGDWMGRTLKQSKIQLLFIWIFIVALLIIFVSK